MNEIFVWLSVLVFFFAWLNALGKFCGINSSTNELRFLISRNIFQIWVNSFLKQNEKDKKFYVYHEIVIISYITFSSFTNSEQTLGKKLEWQTQNKYSVQIETNKKWSSKVIVFNLLLKLDTSLLRFHHQCFCRNCRMTPNMTCTMCYGWFQYSFHPNLVHWYIPQRMELEF